jgi:DNA-binding GntR family transcriptional regulator
MDGDAKLGKIEARSLQARVYHRLKTALMVGEFRPGQVLLIRDLATELGTSHMPVRQSLYRLVSEHALQEEDKARSSVRVPELSEDVFQDLRRVRLLAECEAASLAARNATKPFVKKLRALDAAIATAVEQENPSEAIYSNYRFHFAVYAQSGSQVLMRTIESLWLQSGPYFRVLIDRYFATRSSIREVNAHSKIITAMTRNDPEAARAALADDINRAADFYINRNRQ